MARSLWGGVLAGTLCSLKHNSKFASFSILTKGDYPAELNIPFPFSLISNDVSRDQLIIMPDTGSSMYALARNSWKYADGDKRTERIQELNMIFWRPIPLMKCSVHCG